jgi:hypothetical protein
MLIYGASEDDFVLLHCVIQGDPNLAWCYAFRSRSH